MVFLLTLFQLENLAKELLEECRKLQRTESSGPNQEDAGQQPRSLVGSRLQKGTMKKVMDMVERESAIIEAVKARLERLIV